MLAGAAINIGMVTGIRRNVRASIRTVTVFHAAGLDPEGLQPLFGGGIAADIQPKDVQGALKLRDLFLGHGLATLLNVPKEALADQSGKKSNDHHHDQKLDQRDSAV